MRIAYAHLCDYATISREGKVSVMGIFDNIFAHSFPTVHPMLVVAFGIEMRRAELGQMFEMKIRLSTEDGQVIAELGGRGMIPLEQAPPGNLLLNVPQIVPLAGVPFQKPGGYSIDLFLNNDHKQAISFRAALAPQPPGAPPEVGKSSGAQP